MSILMADVSATTLPATAGMGSAHNSTELIIFWICVAWAIVGIVAATALRAFRRQSIVGPVRVDSIEEAFYLFFVGIIGYLIAMTTGAAFAHRSSLPDDLKLQALQVVIFSTLCFSILITLAITRPNSLARLGLKPGWIPAGLIGGAATLFIVYPTIQITGDMVLMIQSMMHRPEPQAHELLIFLEKNRNPAWRMLGIFSAVVVAPVTEELLFRGLIQTTLGQFFAWVSQYASMPASTESALLDQASTPPQITPGAGHRWAAVLVTAGLFAAIHDSIPFFPPLFVLAIALGYIYERTGNLWMNIATHGLFNTGQILIYLALAH